MGGKRKPITDVTFKISKNGLANLIYQNHVFHKNSEHSSHMYWRCIQRRLDCRARLITNDTELIVKNRVHNHPIIE